VNADWVAASVRARSLAKRRVGAGASHTIAAERSLADGLAMLTGTVYGERLVGRTTLAGAERAIAETLLWQLRVLGGWVPAKGATLIRAAVAAFELDNILDLARSLADGRPTAEPFDLGSLSTAWNRLRTARSSAELTDAVRASPWGESGTLDVRVARDELTIVWLRRFAVVAPAARPWAEGASALIVARTMLVDRAATSPALAKVVRPVLGGDWENSRDLAGLVEHFPRRTQTLFRGITSPKDLWRAEAALRMSGESDGFRLLRGSLPGPDVILGSIAVLAMDAWRVRAALASAALGLGSSEVLDVVA
jgi:hypothetical protein